MKNYQEIDIYTKGTDLTKIDSADFVGAKIFYADKTVEYISKYADLASKVAEFVTQTGKKGTDLISSGDIKIARMVDLIKSIDVYSNGTDNKNVASSDFKAAVITFKDGKSERITNHAKYLDRLEQFAIQKGKEPSKLKLNIKIKNDFYSAIDVYTKGSDLNNVQEADFIGAKATYFDGRVGYITDYSSYKTAIMNYTNQEGKTEEELKTAKNIVIKQMSKNYTSIVVYTDGSDLTNIDPTHFTGAKVTYSDGSGEHYINIAKSDYATLAEIVGEFAIQKGKTPAELITDKTIVIQKVDDINIDSEKKGGKGKKFLKITSICSAVAVIGGTGYLLSEWKKSKNKENPERPKITDTMPTSIPTSTSYRSITPFATSTPVPTINPTNYPMAATTVPDRLTDIVIRMNRGENVEEDDLYYFMNEVNRIVYTNIPGIYDLLSGKPMSGDKDAKIEFYKMFPEDSSEYVVLRVFCIARENLGHNAFYQDSYTVKETLGNYMDSIDEFIFDNTVIDYGNGTATFSQLNPACQYMLGVIGAQTLLGDPTYTGTINGRRCSYVELTNEYAETYSGLVELVLNRYGRRK